MQYQDSLTTQQGQTQEASANELELGLALGFYLFGAALMLMMGSFHLIVGISALFDDEFFSVRQAYDLKLDTTTWGWVQVAAGTIAIVAGTFLLTGATWARILAIAVAVASCIWSFYSIPYYPIWSLAIIALDLGVIWALLTHGDLLKETE